MKKTAIFMTALFMCSFARVSAEPAIVPIGCPLKQPCQVQQPAPCDCMEEDACTLKEKFLEKRCCIYKELCLSDAQVQQARCIDEKFFTEIYPLKKCYIAEKCKLKEMECNKACSNDIKCQKEKVRDLKKQLKDKKKAHHEAIMCLLNDCQKKQYKKICKEMKKKHKAEKKYDCPCN